jgi:hypothetical protein
MRIWTFSIVCGAIAVAASTAFAVSPPATTDAELVLHSRLGDFTGRNAGAAGAAADIKPGETFSITGDCVADVVSADQLRVVLTFAGGTKAAEPGFRSVLAIDQTIRDRSLQVRVPNMPETANRVFQVQVFTLGQAAPEVCEAGAIRIGAATAGKVG